jgi:hypothetical protein
MSWIDRLQGPSRDQSNLDGWAKRASTNSNHGERAEGKPSNGGTQKDSDLPDVHSTGKRMELRDTESRPLARHSIDARMVAKENANHAGDSTYMRGVRRGPN